jgi:Mg-chelatase subunit ChlD/anti-sigma factor RsiW
MNAKLTAYALNELPPDERAALEAEMETNPALRVDAEEMRKFCALLHDEVADADKEALTTEQRVRVLREFSADTQPQPQLQPRAKKAERSIWRHPAFLVPTAIAACTTVMLVINLNDKHSAPATEQGRILVEKPLAERGSGRATAEDVRVKFEKASKPVVAAGQTPAPGKPETPTLVAANSPTVRDAETNALLPLPKAGAPASPTLLMPQSLDGTALAMQTAEAAGAPGAMSSDLNGVSSLGLAPGAPDIAGRGIDIGTARPLKSYQFTPESFGIIPATPAMTKSESSNWSGLAQNSMQAPGYVDLNEPTLNPTPGAAPSLPRPTGTDTFGPGLALGIFGAGILADESRYDDMRDGAYSLSGNIGAPAPFDNTPMVGRLFQSEGTTSVSKVGAGSLTISGASVVSAPVAGEPVDTYTGGTTITAGRIVAANGAAVTPVPDETTATAGGAITMGTSSGMAASAPGTEHFKRAEMKNEVSRGWESPVPAPVATTATTGAIAGSGDVKLQVNGGSLVGNATTAPSSSPAAAAAKPAMPFSRVDLAAAAPAAPPAMGRQALGDTAMPANAAPAASPAPATPRAKSGYQLDLVREDDPTLAANTAGGSTRATAASAPYVPPALAKSLPAESDAPITPELERLQDLQQTTAERIKDIQDKAKEAETRSRQMATRNPSGETYTPIYENPFLQVAQQPLSTFSIDVDTASYANVRRFLNKGQRPPADAVRLEELINYFPYTYEPPAEDGAPFSVTVDMAEAPWQPMHRLARIALKGREVRKDRGAANFVFLVDVSGSMDQPDKLPLVKQSLRMLTEQLKDTDRVAIVTYAGETGVALSSTPGSERKKILRAIEALDAGGSTNGAGGIRMAYHQASENFVQEGVNRVILCTDGDFNVGISSPEELEKLIAEKAKSRVFLSVLGYGTGNLKDRTMETLADKGNGNYAYIDSLSEARKVLVDQMNATLVTIAKDVKIQVEFNPGQVAAYRLLGYENRALAKEDFNNDRKDAGEIGAGHTVTALYEIVPVGAGMTTPDGRPMVDELKYAPKPALRTETATPANPPTIPGGSPNKETMTVKLRYKQPEGDKSQLLEVPVMDKGQTMGDAPQDFVFAAGVTGFGMMLRNSQYSGELTWDMVRALSLRGKGEDPMGYRGEFLQLIDKARGLMEGRE